SAVLDKAEQEGRIFKSERTYLEQLGGQIGVAALSAQLEEKQPIAALSAMQTTTAKKPSQEKPAVAVLSADEQAAVKALGITEAEYLKMKQEQEK
ncbi:protease, partial [Escherichia coli]|nr:protease [Escherichia coli]